MVSPAPKDLLSCGAAQKKTKRQCGETHIPHTEYVARLKKDVHKILDSGREISDFSVRDIHECLELLTNECPRPFEWDISLYMCSRASYNLSLPPALNLEDNISEAVLGTNLFEPTPEDDFGNPPPTWIKTKYHLVNVEDAPFWAIGKYS